MGHAVNGYVHLQAALHMEGPGHADSKLQEKDCIYAKKKQPVLLWKKDALMHSTLQ